MLPLVSKPLPNDPTRSRTDAYMKFVKEKHASDAKKIFKKKLRSLAGQNHAVAFIPPSQYYRGIGLQVDPPAEVDKFVSTPPTIIPELEDEPKGTQPMLAPIPEGSTNSLLLGNIPYELVGNKEEIIKKFSQYGQILDVQIRKYTKCLPYVFDLTHF
jgi:RNA recognition motif-containing protein